MKIFDDNGNELVLVQKVWLDGLEIGEECPFCRSENTVTQPASDQFEARRGCKDCDMWFEPLLTRP